MESAMSDRDDRDIVSVVEEVLSRLHRGAEEVSSVLSESIADD